MRLENTTSADDTTLSLCEDFGGLAHECAQIAEELDAQLTDARQEIEELSRELEEAHAANVG